MERGLGTGAAVGAWISIGIVVGRPFAARIRGRCCRNLERRAISLPRTILQLTRAHGTVGTFELPTRPAPNATYIDVGIRDDRRGILSVIEIWNRFDELGAGARNFKRKLADADGLAVVAGADGDQYRVAGCWVLRATAANRALVSRYPAIFAADFAGSSRGWVDALVRGHEPPNQPGIVWIDLAGTRIWEVRLAHDPARIAPA